MNILEAAMKQNNTSDRISVINSSSHYMHAKVLRNKDNIPYAFAAGFGLQINASLLIGGFNENDDLITDILFLLISKINSALENNEMVMGIDIRKLLANRGVWIIPDVSLCESSAKLFNFISKKIYPTKLMELHMGEPKIKCNFGKNTPYNNKLLAYLMSASGGMNVDKSFDLNTQSNSICDWYVNNYKKPAYSLSFGDNFFNADTNTDMLLENLLETFLVFIGA